MGHSVGQREAVETVFSSRQKDKIFQVLDSMGVGTGPAFSPQTEKNLPPEEWIRTADHCPADLGEVVVKGIGFPKWKQKA